MKRDFDRADIAAQVGADGVHLGQSDMSLSEAREKYGKDIIIGISVNNNLNYFIPFSRSIKINDYLLVFCSNVACSTVTWLTPQVKSAV